MAQAATPGPKHLLFFPRKQSPDNGWPGNRHINVEFG